MSKRVARAAKGGTTSNSTTTAAANQQSNSANSQAADNAQPAQTAQNQPAQAPQSQPTQSSQSQPVNTPATDDRVAVCLEKLTELSADHEKVLSEHEKALSAHEKRLKALEDALKAIQQPAKQPVTNSTVAPVTSSSDEPNAAPTLPNAVPVKGVNTSMKSPMAKPGYTGKALVFFIHGEDGDIDWARPFYSPNVAKHYDWNYRIIPAWVENGAYVRALTADEAAGFVW